jgi:hypothetical protein
MMILHIFRKDFRLLWPLILMVAAIQFANAGVRFALGHFGDPPQLAFIADLVSSAMFLGLALLIVTAVHHDPVPGVHQDWLIRPIARGDLILAKLLFVLVAVHGPMMVADLAHAVLAGIPIADAFSATLIRSGVLFLSFDLPMVALATVTATMTEALGGALAIWLLVLAGLVVGSAVHGGPPPLAGSGLQWMTPTYWSLLALFAAAIIIPLQYFRRSTRHARRVALGAIILAPLLSFSSWASAFAVQQWLSPDPAAARPIAIMFDAKAGKLVAAPFAVPRGTIALPIGVSGLAPNSIVRNDRAIVRIIDHDGGILFSGPTTTWSSQVDDFPVRTAVGGDVRMHQLIALPVKIVETLRNRPVRMEIDYSLTLLRLEAAVSMQAVDGQERLDAFGSCRSKVDEDGEDVVVGCLKTGRIPTCVSGTLEDRTRGHRNPETTLCRPDYAPFAISYLDVLRQFDGELKFRDTESLAEFPVGGSRLTGARALLSSYHAQAHFTRRLVLEDVRLSDWRAVQ